MTRNNKASVKRTMGLITVATFGVLSAVNVSADPVIDALSNSKVSGNFRLRYESVDVDSASVKDAKALTLRSRLGIETGAISGFTAVVEGEDTHVIAGVDDYSPAYKDSSKPANNPYDYAAIVDPEVTEINRAYLRYQGIPKLDVGLGRQRIILDNQCFIGNNGWRQSEQTFDALTANYLGLTDWGFYYAHINRVKGVANSSPLYNFNIASDDNLLNISFNGWSYGKFAGYAYLLKNEEPDRYLLNTNTNNHVNPTLRYRTNDSYGLRFDGGHNFYEGMPLKILYTAEFAKQQLKVPTRTTFNTNYHLLDAGLSYTTSRGVWSARYAQEVMGSDHLGTTFQGFQTPYGTKHPFDGWADLFLNTPASGIKDSFMTITSDIQSLGMKITAVYHDYYPDDGPGKFGRESDIQILKQFSTNYTLGIKYAAYAAGKATASNFTLANNIDTNKLWVWGELNF